MRKTTNTKAKTLLGVIVLAYAGFAMAQTSTGTFGSNQENLLAFAKANCFFWYFQKKSYDLTDIKAISGDVVGADEAGPAAVEKYIEVAALVRNYRPPVRPSSEVDMDLYKCFYLERDATFHRVLATIEREFRTQPSTRPSSRATDQSELSDIGANNPGQSTLE